MSNTYDKAILNGTPIKSRQATPHQHSNHQTATRYQKPGTDRSNPERVFERSAGRASPSRINPSPKPKPIELCANHSNKLAEYEVTIQGEKMYYCEKCGLLLASQDFPVRRLKSRLNFSSLQSSSQSKPSTPFITPSNPRLPELTCFCSSAKSLLSEFQQSILSLNNLHHHYLQQQQLIQDFHNALVESLNQLRSQHLKMLKSEKAKYLKIAEIQRTEAEEIANQLNDILNDIEGNKEEIVGRLPETRYREVMACYDRKMRGFGEQADEMGVGFQGVTCLSVQELKIKFKDFNKMLTQFFAAQGQHHSFNIQKSDLNQSITSVDKLIKLANLLDRNKPIPHVFQHDTSLQSPMFKQL